MNFFASRNCRRPLEDVWFSLGCARSYLYFARLQPSYYLYVVALKVYILKLDDTPHN